MADIYRRAAAVLVWLGPSMDDSDAVMDLIINEAKNPNRNPIELLDPRLMHVTKIRQLFNRPYWSRVWVIQEIALSESDPLVGCGDKWIP